MLCQLKIGAFLCHLANFQRLAAPFSGTKSSITWQDRNFFSVLSFLSFFPADSPSSLDETQQQNVDTDPEKAQVRQFDTVIRLGNYLAMKWLERP